MRAAHRPMPLSPLIVPKAGRRTEGVSHRNDSRVGERRTAIVLANPAISSTTGWPVGFW